MLIDRYAPEDVFARVPELADQTDPVLLELDHLLDDDTLYQQVRRDLAHRYRLTPVHGRHSTPAEVLMRLLVVQHLYAWSYQETVARTSDGFLGPALVLPRLLPARSRRNDGAPLGGDDPTRDPAGPQ